MRSRVAICLFDETVTDFELDKLLSGSLPKVRLRKVDSNAELYVKKSNSSLPGWIDIVKSFSDLNDVDFITASSGAILFIKVRKRILGCCFGSSVGNIKRDNVISDFGLAVAYKRIPKRSYKGIETHTLTENPITNNRNAALPASTSSFNLDTYLETITELSGKFSAIDKTVLIKGKEFFSIPAPPTLNLIKDLCKELVGDYDHTIKSEDYKRLTAINKVKIKKLIEHLNQTLCDRLNNKSKEVYLVDYQQIDGIDTYSLTPKGDKLLDLEIEDVYRGLNRRNHFTMEYLRSKKITVYSSDAQPIDEWPLYKCLFTEVALNIGGFILFKGSWYEVQKRYLTDLKNFVADHEVSASDFHLMRWDGSQSEGEYNKAAESAIGGQCWDKVQYTHPDFSYGIEFCDLLLPDHVIHVKKLGKSSLSSHLLMQTYVSAQLLKTDLGIRKWIRKQSKETFKKNIFLKASNEFKHPPVSYLIVLMAGTAGKSLADCLPFFSLVTFNMVIRRIRQLDFEIKVCLV